MYRTGKSYLLNRMLLNKEKGFGVGPTVNPCTKGLWIWGSTIPGFTSEGEAINVVVIDTEGLGALDEDSNHDIRVFSLALLLSSYFIYNSMGSIDETALQSLNLVVSITKHIHIKSQCHGEDIEPEEYSKYFPKFIWVVRDFTLQLLDEEGEAITSKEYFERALQLQNGTSESVEQKNKIRKLVKSFFPDRDCCTIVRPLTKEEHLQSIETMNLKELRPEFVEQMMLLRRKVLNMMKIKTLNGNPLNGSMLLNLAEDYVSSINKGVIPNIENAWTYICKNECLKAFQMALEKYDAAMKEVVNGGLPMDSEELKELHRDAYDLALTEFNKVSVAGAGNDYLKDLKSKIKQKFTSIKAENERELKKCIQEFLSSEYMSVEQKLKNNAFLTLEEYERELKSFQRYCIENGPPGPNRLTFIVDYCQRMQSEAARLFTNRLVSEIELQKTLSQDTIQKLENAVAEMKEEHKTEADKLAGRIRFLETEKAELSAKEQGLRENCKIITKEKEAREREMDERLTEAKKDADRTIKVLKEKMAQQEEQVRTAQEKALTSESDSNKQQALLEQKISYLEKTLEEARSKDKEYVTELKNVKKEYMGNLKDLSAKYETQIKEMQMKLDKAKDQAEKLEANIAELQQTYASERSQLSEELDVNKSNSNKTNTFINELKEQLKAANEKTSAIQKSMEVKFAEERNKYQRTVAELQATNKSLTEETKAAKIKWEKEEAIRNQKQEFYEVQLSEAKKQLEEAQKSHENMVKAMEYRNKHELNQEEASKQLMMVKEEHLKELKEIESNHKAIRDRLAVQLEQVTEKANGMELKLMLQKTDHEKEIEAKDECIATLQAQVDKGSQQTKALETQKVKLLEEAERNYKGVIQGLETQMDELKRRQQADLQEVQKHSEESLTQLRNFYEIEKERLEARINEERVKAQKICAQQQEESEKKLKEEQQQRAEEVEALQSELENCTRQNRDIINEIEQELEMQKQKTKGLDDQLKDCKEQFAKMQNMNSTTLEQQLNSFSEERRRVLEKIEKLSHEITMKERQMTVLENRNESIKQDLERNTKTLNEWKAERAEEKNILTDKVEALKVKNQELFNELMQKKLEFNRESALLKQQADFQSSKIQELQSNVEEITKRYEEKLQMLKQESSQQLKDTIDLLSKDKDQYEQKYEEKRKALKELEVNLNKQTAILEKEKNTLIEKCATLEAKNTERERQYHEEAKALQQQLTQLKEMTSSEKMNSIQEAQKFKKQYMDLDRELYEVQANYDKDKELWADRFKFLEQQRDQSKNDLMEAQRKFELTLEQLQKRGNMDKDKSETNQMALITSLEQKHKYQIKELNESHQHIYNEQVQKSKQLEKELKIISEKLQLEQRAKTAEIETLEKRITEMMEGLAKVSRELDEVKADRDQRVLNYQKLFERERENYKAKLQEIESKYTEIDAKRGAMLMEFEKERAGWSSEKDRLIQQKNEAQEIIVRLEKRKENLMLENDKLKSERSARKPLCSGSSNVSSSMSKHGFIGARKYENFGGIKLVSEERPVIQSTAEIDPSFNSKLKKSVRTSMKRIGDDEYKQ